MDTLHKVMRSLNGETKHARKPLDVFREFLTHLEKINAGAPSKPDSRRTTAARRKPARRSAKA